MSEGSRKNWSDNSKQASKPGAAALRVLALLPFGWSYAGYSQIADQHRFEWTDGDDRVAMTISNMTMTMDDENALRRYLDIELQSIASTLADQHAAAHDSTYPAYAKSSAVLRRTRTGTIGERTFGQYTSLPVTIVAQQWDGEFPSAGAIIDWVESNGGHAQFLETNETPDKDGPRIAIATSEGMMNAKAGDWIIQGTVGEFYPCMAEVFAHKYRPADHAETAGA